MATSAADEKILNMLKAVTAKKAELEQIKQRSSGKWVTNGSYQFAVGISATNTVNLVTANAAQIRAVAMDVMFKQQMEEAVSKRLACEGDGKINGYTFDQWLEDCSTRIAKIELADKTAHLKAMEDKLNGLVSPELRREMELSALLEDELFAKI